MDRGLRSVARRRRPLVAAAVALALLLPAPVPTAPPAHAVTITYTVDSVADEALAPDAAPDSCISTPSRTCTLRAAIQASGPCASACPHEIILPAGFYRLTLAGADETLGATGDLNVRGDVTLTGAGAEATIIDGNGLDRVFHVAYVHPARLNISRVTIQGGRTTNQHWGGGIHSGGPLTVSESTIRNNIASPGRGGGIYQDRPGLIINTTLSGNSASEGAALYQYTTGSSNLTNVTVSGNRGGYGAGVTVEAVGFGAADVTLTNVTISDNSGSLFAGGALTLINADAYIKNSILANSPGQPDCVAGTTSPFASGGHIFSGGGNLTSDASCFARFPDPSDLINTAARLGPLQNNGGPTATHALLSDSPAVDAGLNAGCPPTDQRGVGRPIDGTGRGVAVCDSGAYEYQPPPFAATRTPTPTATPTATATRTPTRTPTPNPCTLPGRINVQAVPNGDGRLRVTVIETAAGEALQSLSFAADGHVVGNGLIDTTTQTGLALPLTLSPPSGATSYTFWLRPLTPGQGTTVAFTVQDSCGTWPTFVGGGPAAFGGAPQGTPVPTAQPPSGAGPTPQPPSTPTPTPAPVCVPRPSLNVATTPLGADRLQVTVTAPASSNDRLLALRFGAATNARIEANTQAGSGGFTVTLPPGAQQTSFSVSRVVAGQTVTVPLTVVDSCGEWPTLVGGGPSAF